ncbi:MAG: bifunctional hydroxymethylpyrimidine kinase/phosphomethylpyrimidine kinase [Methanomassiliicoccales archaeon]|jgi:hydroxymethylpyrimidine/phosphomethylpyrimidine kinase|nr:bifunctional hydroxymethylpyrimidine kinase/phosphomethylpyrimidine kinase [Methanomassiliicoccales archaeon]
MTVALTIAGSDSIGGAGIQADIKALASMGVHAASVVTCVTSQNTQSVSAILPLPVEHVLSQLEAVLGDADVRAVKTGMLYSGEIASAVAGRLATEGVPLVVDPVMVAGVGDSLHAKSLLKALKDDVLPLAALVTPNRAEAEALAGRRIKNLADAKRACRSIKGLGVQSVLLKGGHFEGDQVIDLLFHEGEFVEVRAPRLAVKAHGSGCNLSSYICGYLALGTEMKEAVIGARSRVMDALQAHYQVGEGLEVLDSLATLNREAQRYITMVELKEAIALLQPRLTRDLIPEVGMNFVYALPHARYYEDVCGLEGRMVGLGEGASQTGCLAYGSSKHVARIVLTAIRYDPSKRSALNLRYSKANLDKLQRLGLSVGSFDRRKEPKRAKTMEWGTASVIDRLGYVPDVIYDEGGIGKEPMIRVIGDCPADVLEKIDGIWS